MGCIPFMWRRNGRRVPAGSFSAAPAGPQALPPPEHVDMINAQLNVAGGQVHPLGHQPLLQRVCGAAGQARRGAAGRGPFKGHPSRQAEEFRAVPFCVLFACCTPQSTGLQTTTRWAASQPAPMASLPRQPPLPSPPEAPVRQHIDEDVDSVRVALQQGRPRAELGCPRQAGLLQHRDDLRVDEPGWCVGGRGA
jgi:hypothetical protein